MKNTIVWFIILLGFCGCKPKNGTSLSVDLGKPNIILINADDLGYGDLGCYGATKVQTPNIDKLAAEGRIFTDAHSASAVCSPSRYGLITGSYPLRRNLWGACGMNSPLIVDTSNATLASVLKDAGYATACIGKWHLGFTDAKPDWNKPLKPGPIETGFDYYFGVPIVNSGPPFIYVENHSVVGYDPADPFIKGFNEHTEKWPEKGGYKAIAGAKAAHRLYKDEQVGTTLKNKAVEWLKNQKENGEKPFFMYMATTNVHHPFTPAPQFKGTSQCGRYGDFVHELDWIVGEVLNTLDEMGEKENTLVIVTSDNGGMFNQGGQDAWKAGHRLNGDLLGFKFGAWEGGHRIPMIARWPGKIPANSTSDQLISQIDLLPTFAKLTGQTLSPGDAPDAVDQLESFLGTPGEPVRETLIISPNNSSHLTARKGNWVFIPAQGEGGFQGKEPGNHLYSGEYTQPVTQFVNSDIENGRVKPDAPPAQLYNLANDLAQTTNLYDSHPELVKEFEKLIAEYRDKIGPYKETGWISRRKP